MLRVSPVMEKHISAIPGTSYGNSCNAYIRIAIGVEPTETIQSALITIKELTRETAA